jgi:hypothetical protein
MKSMILVFGILTSLVSFASSDSSLCETRHLGYGGLHSPWNDYAIYCATSIRHADRLELSRITVTVVRKEFGTEDTLQDPIAIKATKKNAHYICKKLAAGNLLNYVASDSVTGVHLDGTVSSPASADLRLNDAGPALETVSCEI